jgi:type I restriction enzyme M protein
MPEGYKHFSKTKPMKADHFDHCIKWWKNRVEIKDSETDSFKAKEYNIHELSSSLYDLDLCGYPTFEEEILSPAETIKNFHEKRNNLNEKIDKVLQEIEELIGTKL